MRLHRTVVAIVAGVTLLATATGSARAGNGQGNRPDTIALPAGFAGEGVTVGAGNVFYAGSLTDGRIARGDLRAGTTEVFVAAPIVAPAVGLKADVRHGLLWVAGGPTGQAAVYDLQSGEPVVALTLTAAASFINDVIVTRDAAYFTNSVVPEIYRVPVSPNGDVGAPETIALQGPAGQFGAGFNNNGIEVTRDGGTLIVVNSVKGELYTVDPDTGESALIDLGGASVATGDGLLLRGKTLFVLQNGTQPGVPNQITVVRLHRHLTVGRVVDTITSPFFETATTLARRGNVLVAVNAQFAGAPIDPEPEVVLLNIND